MVKPERRTATDLAVSAAIVVVVLVAGLLAWYHGSVRTTVSETGTAPSTPATPMYELPGALQPTWSTQADRPVLAVGGTLVAAHGGEVRGLAPATGARTWRYARDTTVCALAPNGGYVLVFHPDARGCGEVTALDPGTGERRYTRSSREDPEVTVTSDGNYAVVQGPTRVDVFRSDLVRTVEYGRPDVAVNPGVQPRSGCTILSALPSGGTVTVLETCPAEAYPRLSVFGTSPRDSTEPQESSSVLVPDLGSAEPDGADRARLIAATAVGAAVYVPAQRGQPARVVVVSPQGRQLQSAPITTAPGGAPADVPIVTEAGIAAFYTGASTVIVDTAALAMTTEIPGALGPGVVIGGQLVVPGPTTFTAYDLGSLTHVTPVPVAPRSVKVDRPGYTSGTVLLTASGETIVAQWGTTVQAYRPA